MIDAVRLLGRSGLRGEETSFIAEIGGHIRTDPGSIARHCLKEIAAASEDIATIVESMALADRLFTRVRSEVWSRQLRLVIPVFEVATLSDPQVSEALAEAASFLTGDEWTFEFIARQAPRIVEQYLPLVDERPKYIVPFSDGLDSFAQAKLLEVDHGARALLRVRTGKLPKKGDSKIGIPLLEIPRRFRAGHPRERSYRTRSFVYFSFAAIVAVTADADSVVIGENGQGALGPSFARFSNEWPFRSAHPGSIARLAVFLSRALGKEVRFEQPQLWRTKGQVIAELKERDLLAQWDGTRSCSLRPLQRKGHAACGYCGGCVLKQTALNAAGVHDEGARTFDLRSSDLSTTSIEGHREPMAKSQKEILVRAALSMATLADLPSRSDASSIVAREVRDIPGGSSEATTRRVNMLIGHHRKEWQGLISSLPTEAWLSREFVAA